MYIFVNWCNHAYFLFFLFFLDFSFLFQFFIYTVFSSIALYLQCKCLSVSQCMSSKTTLNTSITFYDDAFVHTKKTVLCL